MDSRSACIGAAAGAFLGALGAFYLSSRQRAAAARHPPRRIGGLIKLRREQYEEYKRLHAAVWPGVLQRIYDSNIRNFTIYYHAASGYMFHHFEYVGSDYDADMQKIAADPARPS